MDDHRSAEAGLQGLLSPDELGGVVLVGLEHLAVKGHLLLLTLVSRNLRLLFGGVLALVLEVEADGLLEVNLDGSALVLAVESIVDLHIDLGAVESTVAVVESPGLAEGVEGVLESILRDVPLLFRAESVRGPRRKLKLELEAKDAVDVVEEIENGENFRLDLFEGAEDVGVVLLEATNANETAESAGDLVSVEHAEIGVAQGQVAVAVDAVLEHDAMGGTVHGLEAVASLVVTPVEEEHVLLVVGVVTGNLPQLDVVHVRRDHFRVATHAVLLPNHLHQLVVNQRALGEEEGAAGRDFEVVKQILLAADDAMVPLLGLLADEYELVELLLGREGNGVDALQTIVGGLSEPVGRRVAHHLEALDEFSRGDVRARAQIDQVAAAVGSHGLAVLDLARDGLHLEGVGLEEGEGVVLGEDQALELLV